MNYMRYGTNTFPAESVTIVKIVNITFEQENVIIHLGDGRAIQLKISQYPWLRWLLNATPEQRKAWEIVPSGGGVWWSMLDEGIELQPLLDLQPLR